MEFIQVSCYCSSILSEKVILPRLWLRFVRTFFGAYSDYTTDTDDVLKMKILRLQDRIFWHRALIKSLA